LSRKTGFFVAVPAPALADSSPWMLPFQPLDAAIPGAGIGQRRGWNDDKEYSVDFQSLISWPAEQHSFWCRAPDFLFPKHRNSSYSDAMSQQR